MQSSKSQKSPKSKKSKKSKGGKTADDTPLTADVGDAGFGYYYATVPGEVTLEASGSTGSIVSYDWSWSGFCNGSLQSDTATGLTATFTFPCNVIFVTLKVTDSQGATAIDDACVCESGVCGTDCN